MMERKAEEHLAALERIWLIPCEEYEDLKNAVALPGACGPVTRARGGGRQPGLGGAGADRWPGQTVYRGAVRGVLV